MAKESDSIDEKELDAAMKDAKKAPSVYTHKFSEPFTWMGKTYEMLDFDFKSMTGNDYLAIEEVMLSRGKVVVTPEFSSIFLCLMSAKACGLGDDALKAMPFAEFSKIRNVARSFLLKAELR